MFRLSYQLLISRKRWLILLTVIFGLVISSTIAIFAANNTIKSNILNQSFQRYGEFTGVLYNIPEKKEDLFKNANNIGSFFLIDSLRTSNNKLVNIGSVDQEFIDLGHINLITGRFPKESNEIAIESYYLEAIDSKWKIGEFRTITIGNIPRALELVGIVDNYSSKWSVRTISYPNIFVSEHTFSLENTKNNYLIGYNHNNSITKNINEIQNLINAYAGNGFVNDRLFFNGLGQLKNMQIISYGVQFIILLVSSFCILCMLSYFDLNQGAKFAIFKALGCSSKNLLFIKVTQTIYVYILGIIFSLPLLTIFHYIIIKNTYNYSLFQDSLSSLLIGVFVWLVFLFIFIVALSYVSIKTYSKNSINVNLKEKKRHSIFSSISLDSINYYSVKQLIIQILAHPKNAILSTLTLTFSILVILFSFTMAKESAGIWDTQIDYYLTSQELIGTRVINNKTVTVTQDQTFDASEVREIEQIDGIKYIDKTPFMIDISLLFERDMITPSLDTYIKTHKQIRNGEYYANQVIIPHVNYILLNEDEINKLYGYNNKNALESSVILYIPNLNIKEKEQLIDKDIILTKTYLVEDSYTTQEWDFRILDIIDGPYTIKLKEGNISRDGITVIINEKVALEKGITKGYKDLAIYVDEGLSKEKATNIYNKVYALTEGVQGSLFQYIPELIYDNTRITEYLEFLGKLTFCISIILAISCIYIIVFAKYQLQKRYWGIYRTLGMSINKVLLYLILEVIGFFSLAALFSTIIYTIFLFLNQTTYSTMYYIIFASKINIFTFFMLIIAAVFMKQRVNEDSISSLLRIIE